MAAALVAALLLAVAVVPSAAGDWPQWGGPDRDFRVADAGLARKWPEEGPKRLWSRDLGEGFSAIAAVDGRLFTMYRLTKDEEIVAAFAADSGETVWEHRYEALPPRRMTLGFGKGPHSTPVVTGGRVFAIGTFAQLTALDSGSGEPLWSQELWQEHGGNVLARGYAASPIAYGDTVIAAVGGRGHGLMAFHQEDGRVVWQSQDFDASQSSPILIEVGGRDQLVAFVSDLIVGIDPAGGELLWSRKHRSFAAYNISTPIWIADESLLFVSSAYGGGSRALRLATDDGQATAEELWHTNKLRIHFTNAAVAGGHVFASSGGSGSKILVALDLESGEVAWRSRDVRRCNFVIAGDTVLILDAEARLMSADLSADGLTVLSETRLWEGESWTVPTLVGRTLYVRSEKIMMALELPAASEPPSG